MLKVEFECGFYHGMVPDSMVSLYRGCPAHLALLAVLDYADTGAYIVICDSFAFALFSGVPTYPGGRTEGCIL